MRKAARKSDTPRPHVPFGQLVASLGEVVLARSSSAIVPARGWSPITRPALGGTAKRRGGSPRSWRSAPIRSARSIASAASATSPWRLTATSPSSISYPASFGSSTRPGVTRGSRTTTTAFWYWSVWQSRRITKEIAVLDEIERELRDDDRITRRPEVSVRQRPFGLVMPRTGPIDSRWEGACVSKESSTHRTALRGVTRCYCARTLYVRV